MYIYGTAGGPICNLLGQLATWLGIKRASQSGSVSQKSRWEEDHQLSSMSACGMGSLHIWKGTINAERYIQVLEQHMLPSRRRLFQGRPCIFQHDNARPHSASITTSWLRRRRIRVLKLASLQSRSFTHRKHLAHYKEEDATKKT